jgi:hypothetical protein
MPKTAFIINGRNVEVDAEVDTPHWKFCSFQRLGSP